MAVPSPAAADVTLRENCLRLGHFRVAGDPSLKEVAVDVKRRLKEAVDNV